MQSEYDGLGIIKEIRIIENSEEKVNELLKKGWVILKVTTTRLMRFKTIDLVKFVRVQQFDQLVTQFVLGKPKK